MHPRGQGLLLLTATRGSGCSACWQHTGDVPFTPNQNPSWFHLCYCPPTVQHCAELALCLFSRPSVHTHTRTQTYRFFHNLDLSKHLKIFSAYYYYITPVFSHICISKIHKLLFLGEVRNAHHWYLNIVSVPSSISLHIATSTHRYHTCAHMHTQAYLCTHTHTDYILFLPGRDIDLENIKTTSEPSAQLLTKQKVKKE